MATSTAYYESAGIQHVLAAEAAGDLHARHPYIYAAAEDLCVADVRLVLSAYKEMVVSSNSQRCPYVRVLCPLYICTEHRICWLADSSL